MKKLFVNEEACIGCGACVAIDRNHFDFNDDGLSEVINNENIETEEAQNAISSCPTNAICYIETEECECDDCDCDHCECDGKDCHCESCQDDCGCGGVEDDECDCSDCHCHENQ